ncbi:hypothetical protein Pelo_13795 [Pelomyxa schiedti]|nr:hypothetical protein Pelo_13795 [Pelomyxa schiedti]
MALHEPAAEYNDDGTAATFPKDHRTRRVFGGDSLNRDSLAKLFKVSKRQVRRWSSRNYVRFKTVEAATTAEKKTYKIAHRKSPVVLMIPHPEFLKLVVKKRRILQFTLKHADSGEVVIKPAESSSSSDAPIIDYEKHPVLDDGRTSSALSSASASAFPSPHSSPPSSPARSLPPSVDHTSVALTVARSDQMNRIRDFDADDGPTMSDCAETYSTHPSPHHCATSTSLQFTPTQPSSSPAPHSNMEYEVTVPSSSSSFLSDSAFTSPPHSTNALPSSLDNSQQLPAVPSSPLLQLPSVQPTPSIPGSLPQLSVLHSSVVDPAVAVPAESASDAQMSSTDLDAGGNDDEDDSILFYDWTSPTSIPPSYRSLRHHQSEQVLPGTRQSSSAEPSSSLILPPPTSTNSTPSRYNSHPHSHSSASHHSHSSASHHSHRSTTPSTPFDPRTVPISIAMPPPSSADPWSFPTSAPTIQRDPTGTVAVFSEPPMSDQLLRLKLKLTPRYQIPHPKWVQACIDSVSAKSSSSAGKPPTPRPRYVPVVPPTSSSRGRSHPGTIGRQHARFCDKSNCPARLQFRVIFHFVEKKEILLGAMLRQVDNVTGLPIAMGQDFTITVEFSVLENFDQ